MGRVVHKPHNFPGWKKGGTVWTVQLKPLEKGFFGMPVLQGIGLQRTNFKRQTVRTPVCRVYFNKTVFARIWTHFSF